MDKGHKGQMSDREVMQQALEVLERCPALYRAPEAATALRDRLAQPEQEPVAWVRGLTSAQPNCVTDLRYMSVADIEAGVQYIPLYAAPPKQSEQEPPTVADLLCVCGAGWEWRNRDWELVETPPKQPEQEPVAWMYTSQYKGNERYITRYQSELTTYKAVDVWPLYTAPPKRKWQGLTDEEIVVCGGMDGADNWVFEFANALQIKLREKNHE